jgi:hypothetical protein
MLKQGIGTNSKRRATRKSAIGQAGVDQMIYGTKIIPLLKVKTATTITTITAGTTFKSFIAKRYRCAGIASVQNCTNSEPLWVLVPSYRLAVPD